MDIHVKIPDDIDEKELEYFIYSFEKLVLYLKCLVVRNRQLELGNNEVVSYFNNQMSVLESQLPDWMKYKEIK